MEVLESGYLVNGLYRNHQGREMRVLGIWMTRGQVSSLGRIYRAQTIESWGTDMTYAVTAESMRDAGYERVGD